MTTRTQPNPVTIFLIPHHLLYQYIRNNGRKYGKNKQKGGGKSSRGGKGKDKKQARKNGGTTTKFKPEQDDSLASFSEPEAGIIDFNVVNTVPFRGSSFLKKSGQNLHFPVAEAT
ncbi:uncharacterized protein LOC125209366 [Salvia hispanica]|uniref:uncharacterized protein LOC125209366 n=1 Tax=Salvia hispanica TaxID=49212 RepID=UPI0020090844|nr:uncharacterized protein LOC125209366 [Salvia hispanica]